MPEDEFSPESTPQVQQTSRSAAQPVKPIPYFNDARQQNYQPLDFAGFGIRLVAFLVDGAICYLPREGIKAAVQNFYGFSSGLRFRLNSFQSREAAALGVYFAIGIVFQWLYGALLESSPKQGTLGKMICRIKVTDLRGRRLSFAHATGRHFAKIPSGLLCYVGYLKALEEPKHQAFHDQLAKTLVLRSKRMSGR